MMVHQGPVGHHRAGQGVRPELRTPRYRGYLNCRRTVFVNKRRRAQRCSYLHRLAPGGTPIDRIRPLPDGTSNSTALGPCENAALLLMSCVQVPFHRLNESCLVTTICPLTDRRPKATSEPPRWSA